MKYFFSVFFITLILFFACSDKKPDQTINKEIKAEPKMETAVDTTKAVQKETESVEHEKTDKILGSWIRPDGGYILDIKNFNKGSFEASYYNPKSIFIAETEWKIQDGYVYLFIKFDDEGYPGSYYSLGYYPEKDLLAGFYYQAVAKQKFDVYFQRESRKN